MKINRNWLTSILLRRVIHHVLSVLISLHVAHFSLTSLMRSFPFQLFPCPLFILFCFLLAPISFQCQDFGIMKNSTWLPLHSPLLPHRSQPMFDRWPIRTKCFNDNVYICLLLQFPLALLSFAHVYVFCVLECVFTGCACLSWYLLTRRIVAIFRAGYEFFYNQLNTILYYPWCGYGQFSFHLNLLNIRLLCGPWRNKRIL